MRRIHGPGALGVALSLLGGLGMTAAHAAVIRVPGDFSRLPNAVAAAAPGDTVQVAGNGGATYPVSGLVIDKDLTLQGGWRVDFAVRDPDIYVSVLIDTTGADRLPVVGSSGPRPS